MLFTPKLLAYIFICGVTIDATQWNLGVLKRNKLLSDPTTKQEILNESLRNFLCVEFLRAQITSLVVFSRTEALFSLHCHCCSQKVLIEYQFFLSVFFFPWKILKIACWLEEQHKWYLRWDFCQKFPLMLFTGISMV